MSTPPSTTSSRIFFLDSMRGILMVLGVLLHASQIFNPDHGWKIWSENSSVAAAVLVEIVHAFRMPAFFVVSGFFFVVSLLRYTPGSVLKDRLTRLLIPLLVVGFTLNVLQQWVLSRTGFGEPFDFRRFVVSGEWVSHLWFLINLLVYALIAAALAMLATGPAAAALRQRLAWLGRQHPLVFMLLLAAWGPVMPMLDRLGVPVYQRFLGFLSVYSLLDYLPFYVFGVVLAANKRLFTAFCEMSPLMASGLLVAALVASKFLGAIPEPSMPVRGAMLYVTELVSWASVALCFWVFARVFTRRSKYGDLLAGASYSIYLFHHLLVICFGIVLINLRVPVLPSLLIIVVCATTLSLLIHQFIVSKSSLLRLLFNGVPLKKAPRAPLPAN